MKLLLSKFEPLRSTEPIFLQNPSRLKRQTMQHLGLEVLPVPRVRKLSTSYRVDSKPPFLVGVSSKRVKWKVLPREISVSQGMFF